MYADEFTKDITSRLTEDALELINKTDVPANRSGALVRLAYDCAESGLTNNEIALVLENKGLAWGKFNNKDIHTKCKHIIRAIEYARVKYEPNDNQGRYIKE